MNTLSRMVIMFINRQKSIQDPSGHLNKVWLGPKYVCFLFRLENN